MYDSTQCFELRPGPVHRVRDARPAPTVIRLRANERSVWQRLLRSHGNVSRVHYPTIRLVRRWCEMCRKEDQRQNRADKSAVKAATLIGRGDRIRTCDPLVPNQVLYQAEPLP